MNDSSIAVTVLAVGGSLLAIRVWQLGEYCNKLKSELVHERACREAVHSAAESNHSLNAQRIENLRSSVTDLEAMIDTGVSGLEGRVEYVASTSQRLIPSQLPGLEAFRSSFLELYQHLHPAIIPPEDFNAFLERESTGWNPAYRNGMNAMLNIWYSFLTAPQPQQSNPLVQLAHRVLDRRVGERDNHE